MNHIQHMMGEKAALELMAETKNASHAYIFEGEKGLYTGEAALWFAAALLCHNNENAPCSKCTSCIQAMSGNNPDINYMSLGDITSKKSIGADDIRFIISDAYTKPFAYKKKIYIISDGDALTPQAQNAMLKILEEPPLYVVFIICTENAESILPTVRSRSRLIRFRPVTKEKIVSHIKEKYPEMADKADFVSSFAEGIAGRADFVCNKEVYAVREQVIDALERLLCERDEKVIFEFCELFEEYKAIKNSAYDMVQAALDFALSFVSDIVKAQNGCTNMIINSDKKDTVCTIGERISTEKANLAAETIMETKQMILKYVSAKAAIMRLATVMYYGGQ